MKRRKPNARRLTFETYVVSDLLSTSQAARLAHVTPQAVSKAKRAGRLVPAASMLDGRPIYESARVLETFGNAGKRRERVVTVRHTASGGRIEHTFTRPAATPKKTAHAAAKPTRVRVFTPGTTAFAK